MIVKRLHRTYFGKCIRYWKSYSLLGILPVYIAQISADAYLREGGTR